MSDLPNNHPIWRAWLDYKQTEEAQVQLLLHDEGALFAGFRDGWMHGRMRRQSIQVSEPGLAERIVNSRIAASTGVAQPRKDQSQ